MQDFVKNLSSLWWWVSVVLVGITLDVVGSYFRTGLDRNFLRFGQWRKARTQKQMEAQQRLIEFLNGDDAAVVIFVVDTALAAIYSAMMATISSMTALFVLALRVLGLSTTDRRLAGFYAIGAFTWFLCFIFFRKARSRVRIIGKTREGKLPELLRAVLNG